MPRAWWYAYHLMAALSTVLLIGGAVIVVVALADRDALLAFIRSSGETFRKVAPILEACLISALWLWVAMLRDYLAHRASRPKRWGTLLVVMNWGAAIAYFILVWRSAQSRGGT